MATAEASGKTLVLTMIDLKRAFDTVHRMHLEKVLRTYGYDEISIQLIKQLWEDEVVLKFGDRTYSKPFATKHSVAQGDVLSSFIFSLCCDLVLRSCMADLKGFDAMDSKGVIDLIKVLLYRPLPPYTARGVAPFRGGGRYKPLERHFSLDRKYDRYFFD